MRGVVPGLALCGVGTALAIGINKLVPTVSPLLIAIVLGAVLANTVSLPQQLSPGLQFSAKKLLRLGVALLGLQLVLSDVLQLGWGILGVVVVIVVLGIIGTVLVGKWMGIAVGQRILIACGFSICGAAAVAAADGVVKAKDEEVATAVALVVLFGTLMIPIVPLISSGIGLSEENAGLWAGGSIHEVAQVVAAGGAIGSTALAVAVVVKLARVMMLAPVMAVLGLMQRRRTPNGDAGKLPPLVPLFVIGFIACVALRSSGIVPDSLVSIGKTLQLILLTAAMFALGIGVKISMLRRVGLWPFALAAVSTVWVAAIALVGVLLVA
ncbi:putative sulfate exporter family transporter [Gordonia hydrophobica]|uniref:Sulfate exporter family transporter n=1 Tax=Gordonia hydrophobica TaxID=40516 RepID=A0ABZ2U5J4_9ACTN|nr:putative sulfate exporter family transporter [Gordonia hydrophobica]